MGEVARLVCNFCLSGAALSLGHSLSGSFGRQGNRLLYSILFFSILFCVLPLQEVALRQSPPTFSIFTHTAPCCPTMSSLQRRFGLLTDLTLFICRSVFLTVHLLSFIRVMCPAYVHSTMSMCWTMSVSLVLCLMMVLRILSFSLTLSIFLSMARWLVSGVFTDTLVRHHVWHPHVHAGKTHWLKTFLFRLMGRCLSRKMSLYFAKTLRPAFIFIETSCFVLGNRRESYGSGCKDYFVQLSKTRQRLHPTAARRRGCGTETVQY